MRTRLGLMVLVITTLLLSGLATADDDTVNTAAARAPLKGKVVYRPAISKPFKPAPGAIVEVRTQMGKLVTRTKTKADGTYTVKNLNVGWRYLVKAKSGYRTAQAAVTIKAPETWCNLTLWP